MHKAAADSADDQRGSVVDAALLVLENLVVVASYGAVAAIVLIFPAATPVATPLWPPTGFAFGLALLRGRRIWPGILAGSFLSALLITNHSPWQTGFISAGTLAAIIAGTWLLDLWSNGFKTFAIPSGVAKFALISFVPVAMISSLCVLTGAVLANDTAWSAETWIRWWLADAAGTLVIAPVIVLWARMPSAAFSTRAELETGAILLLAAAVGIVAYSPLIAPGTIAGLDDVLSYRALLGFFAWLPLLWAALRGDQRVVATASLVFCAFAIWGFSEGINPFSKANSTQALLLLLAIVLSASVPPLFLAAAVATRKRAEDRLISTRNQLSHDIGQARLALDIANRHFQILIEGVADYAIFVLDTAGRISSWNKAAQQIIGYAAEEIIGKHFGIFYRPDERRAGEPNRALELAVQEGKHELEGWRIKKNGTPFFVTGLISSIRDEEGNLLGFANVLRDTTERRDAQEKLVQAREQLAMAQKMEAIGKLTGGIAHDFNNLLMIIGGNSQTVKRLLDPKLPRAIEAIQIAAKRGESLTRQLLTFSRRQHLSPTVVDLSVSIKNMRTMIESSLRGNIVYQERIGDSVWPVKIDLAELELAIVNLAVNARDAMPNGGTFTLSLHNTTADYEIEEERVSGNFVAIEFSDTGMGIPPNLLSKIFDPFFTTKEVGKGSGLGLSQVYGFAHQAGGTVTARSTVGQGTTIMLYLPVCADEQIASKDPSAGKLKESKRPAVLVVDDSADVAEVTSSLFDHLGYDTVYRDSAEAALKLLDEGAKFDLVFSDIVMPGAIDGVGLAREIQSRYPSLPVVLTTGYSDAARAAPSNLKILPKPFDTDALRDFIQDSRPAALVN